MKFIQNKHSCIKIQVKFGKYLKKKQIRNLMTNVLQLSINSGNYWVQEISNSKWQHIFNKCYLFLLLALIREHQNLPAYIQSSLYYEMQKCKGVMI